MQPEPKPNDSRPIWELVIEDMQSRDHVGRERYGTPLQANNGRDSLRDAYEEALDLAVYLKTAIEERDEIARLATENAALRDCVKAADKVVNDVCEPLDQKEWQIMKEKAGIK